MEVFSTHGVPIDRKVTFWNEISSETFAVMEIAARNAAAFDGQLRRESLGQLTLMDVHSAAVRIRRTRAHIARTHEASWLLLAPLIRPLQLSIDGARAITVGSGEFCLLDHAQPYEIVHGDATRTLCVDIPRRLFDAGIGGSGRHAGRLMRSDSPGARLLVAMLRAIGAEFQEGSTLMLQPETSHGLWSLIVAAYADSAGPALPGSAAGRVRAIRADIDAHLTDPALCPAQVAMRCGLSERYLRRLMQSAGESFSEYLLRRRLELCARRLRDPSLRLRTVTEIAYGAGFSDLTHFGRVFKARYGVTPRGHRHEPEGN